MPYVSVPKDLTKVKSKAALGMTKRQLVCFGAGAIIGVPVFFLTRGALGDSAAVMIMIAVMLPAFFLAMYERDGQPAEKILKNVLRSRWYYPRTRPYVTNNLYKTLDAGRSEHSIDQCEKAGKTPGTGKTTAKSE